MRDVGLGVPVASFYCRFLLATREWASLQRPLVDAYPTKQHFTNGAGSFQSQMKGKKS